MSDRICRIDDCTKPSKKRSRLCSMHSARVTRHGDPNVTIAPKHRKVKRGVDNPRWNKAGSYSAIHQRLRTVRGPARAHACVDCGGTARQWSLDRRADGGLPSDFGPFSLDLSRYVPRCVPCHKRHDLAALS